MILTVCVWLLLGGLVSAFEPLPLPQTGQTVISDQNTPPRDDGALQAGVPLPRPRFLDMGNGTFTDRLTGLAWLRRANCAGVGRTWQEALDDVASLNATGRMNGLDCHDTSGRRGTHQTDWRLPNVRELLSLVHYGFSQPALSNTAGTGPCVLEVDCPFINFFTVMPGPYWSSTSRGGDPVLWAWYVDFIEGMAAPTQKRLELGVLAVRGGVVTPPHK
jgi:hypothetical protein